MLKFKHLFLSIIVLQILVSCSGFSKTLNKGTSAEQYKMASDLYEAGKYNKALQLFEKVIPAYRGKPQMERIQYQLSKANYETENYLLAAYHFERFTKNYPKSTKKEKALFLSAHSYYLSIPKSSLDQTDTKKAIESFQNFITIYPESEKIKEANKYIQEMQYNLEKKAYDIAYNYYHTSNFKAAVVAFDSFLINNLGTKFKEDALYYKAKSAYDLAVKSTYSKKEERIRAAIKAVDRVNRNFKETKYEKDLNRLKSDLEDELSLIVSTKN